MAGNFYLAPAQQMQDVVGEGVNQVLGARRFGLQQTQQKAEFERQEALREQEAQSWENWRQGQLGQGQQRIDLEQQQIKEGKRRWNLGEQINLVERGYDPSAVEGYVGDHPASANERQNNHDALGIPGSGPDFSGGPPLGGAEAAQPITPTGGETGGENRGQPTGFVQPGVSPLRVFGMQQNEMMRRANAQKRLEDVQTWFRGRSNDYRDSPIAATKSMQNLARLAGMLGYGQFTPEVEQQFEEGLRNAILPADPNEIRQAQAARMHNRAAPSEGPKYAGIAENYERAAIQEETAAEAEFARTHPFFTNPDQTKSAYQEYLNTIPETQRPGYANRLLAMRHRQAAVQKGAPGVIATPSSGQQRSPPPGAGARPDPRQFATPEEFVAAIHKSGIPTTQDEAENAWTKKAW